MSLTGERLLQKLLDLTISEESVLVAVLILAVANLLGVRLAVGRAGIEGLFATGLTMSLLPVATAARATVDLVGLILRLLLGAGVGLEVGVGIALFGVPSAAAMLLTLAWALLAEAVVGLVGVTSPKPDLILLLPEAFEAVAGRWGVVIVAVGTARLELAPPLGVTVAR